MKQKITLIAAVARDGAIGRDGDLLWHIRDDMRHFRTSTMGKPLVMGRHPFESLPGPLPG
ncbi:MAG: dihydrofolate reductase, partial [Muribaculaceae bacterium]|nr:dihydrofolate reductase [Muribaculaceae bacterium]